MDSVWGVFGKNHRKIKLKTIRKLLKKLPSFFQGGVARSDGVVWNDFDSNNVTRSFATSGSLSSFFH